MITGIGETLKTALRVVTGRKPLKLSLIAADEQTRKSWAKAIKSYDEVPDVYRDFLKMLPGGAMPYMILTPSYEGFMSPTSERLLCSFGDRVFIAEKQRDRVVSTCYPFEDINYVEIGTILLKAWIKISGVAGSGALTSSTFKFNSVTDYLFDPLLRGIRPASLDAGEAALKAERAKFDYLRRPNFKFMNYARRSILPGERVLQSILQPAIRAQILKVFNLPFFRTITPAHITILTDKELIVIQDEGTRLRDKPVEYGGIWKYIPLRRIVSLSLAQREGAMFVLSIHLCTGDRITFLFAASAERELRLLLEQVEGLLPGSTAGRMVPAPQAA
jgi:hypothetical protein